MRYFHIKWLSFCSFPHKLGGFLFKFPCFRILCLTSPNYMWVLLTQGGFSCPQVLSISWTQRTQWSLHDHMGTLLFAAWGFSCPRCSIRDYSCPQTGPLPASSWGSSCPSGFIGGSSCPQAPVFQALNLPSKNTRDLFIYCYLLSVGISIVRVNIRYLFQIV